MPHDSSGGQTRPETWSVVIPALCEAESIQATVRSALDCARPPCEVLVVDGGSTDGTRREARRAGAKVLRSPRGRGAQLNAGWRAARGEWVLFLHADSRLPADYSSLLDEQLRQAEQREGRRGGGDAAVGGGDAAVGGGDGQQLAGPGTGHGARPRRPWWLLGGGRDAAEDGAGRACGCSACGGGAGGGSSSCSSSGGAGRSGGTPSGGGSRDSPCSCSCAQQRACPAPAWGCFATIRATGLSAWQAGLLSAGVELRTRLLWRPYGDQCLFGFKEWPLLEDLDMARRLGGAAGRPLVVPAAVTTSGRRWAKLGFWRTFVTNQAVLAGFAAGVDVHELARLYATNGGGGGGSGSGGGTEAQK
ncbi:hypothetical protein Rsub_01881 [Raphidocelis subcapitata]|uniref:Glycosyltransferase 2-like domain-containing protein n=1 Tax=Raphidocelis subcapitata TaxID=307507 RepID=A0A2V0NNM0_9CHLO|nr:hypothetical protein Rsub_01881 [Raphidocelis subcapitata]|eukprot:GBF89164.1 hypothetical protein Rsub_01881 [Raphidocelis subcapitata]